MLVLDSSALLAWLRRERGALDVRRLLRLYAGRCFAHVVNLCEVYRHFAQWDDMPTAERAMAIITAAGVVARDDLDPTFWREVAVLIADARRPGRGLAMGDAFGLVLARRLGAEFVAAEHGELDAIHAVGTYHVNFVR